MPGLLDFLNTDESRLGMGLLAAAGPSATPMSFGQRLQGAMSGLDADKLRKLQGGLLSQQFDQGQMTLDDQKRKAVNEQGLAGLMPQYFQPGGAADIKGYTSAAMSKGYMNPIEAIKLQQALAKDSQINKLDVKDFTPDSVAKFSQSNNYGDLVRMDKLHFADTGGGVTGMNPFTGAAVGTTPKTGDPFKDLILNDPSGGFTANNPLIGAKQSIAKAGAARTDVRIENKMGEGIASQVGPMLKDSALVAEGAAKQIYAADQIIKSVDSNKMFGGTGATLRLTAAQVADTLGLGGNTNTEKIANTRQAIQGLAQLTLQGRQQMKGQGAVTESEGALAERAVSGDISMTPAEIKQLAGAAKRSASYMQSEHQRKLSVVKSNPNLAGMAPFYDVSPVPEAPAAPATASPDYRFENGKLVKVK